MNAVAIQETRSFLRPGFRSWNIKLESKARGRRSLLRGPRCERMPNRMLFVNNSSWEFHHVSFTAYSQLLKYIPVPNGAVDGATRNTSRLRYVLRWMNWNLRVWPQHFPFELSEAKLARESEGIVHHLYGETTCFLTPFFAPGRTVATFHLPPVAFQRVESRLWKGMARWLAAAVAVSKHQREFLRETLGIPTEFIPLGIDMRAARSGLPARAPKVRGRRCLFVGKYLRDFEALEGAVRELEPETTVLIVSEAPEAVRLRERLQSDPAKANVVFHSWVPDAVFLDLLSGADVFLLALKDGTANTALLGAMAAGLAIVSFGSYHPSDYLPPTAKCFDRDGEQAANEVERLFENPRRLEEMRISSISMAESLDWSRVVPRLLKLYNSVL